jgi:hypothetical protein
VYESGKSYKNHAGIFKSVVALNSVMSEAMNLMMTFLRKYWLARD